MEVDENVTLLVIDQFKDKSLDELLKLRLVNKRFRALVTHILKAQL